MKNIELPPYDSLFSILRNSNPLEKDYNDFQNTVISVLTTDQEVAKLRMDRIPPTGAENYSYLQSVWKNNNMQCFSSFLKWYNNKDVVLTLEAMQKMIEVYHNKGIGMLKLECTLPNLADICLHKTRDSKFHSFTKSDKDLLEKIREDMVGGPSIVFTLKAVLDGNFTRKSSNLFKSMLVLILVSFIPTQCVNQWQLDCIRNGSTILILRDSQLVKTKLSPLRIWFYHTSIEVDQIAKIESNVTTVRRKKIDCFSVDGTCYDCNTVLETMGCCFY